MKDLCPEIYRQRLVIEGKYTAELSQNKIKNFLQELSEKLSMKIIYGPVVKDIAGGINPKHKGFECVLVWAESGASVYVWEKFKFFTIDIYTCKPFPPRLAVDHVKEFFKTEKLSYRSV